MQPESAPVLFRRPASAGQRRFPAHWDDGTAVPAMHVRVDDGRGDKRVFWDPPGVVAENVDRLALFGADKLSGNEQSLMLVEGERTRKAVAAHTPAVVATYGTGHTPSDAALEVFRGKQVALLSADAEPKGRDHMIAVGRRIKELGLVERIIWMNPPAPVEEGWDLADADDETMAAVLAGKGWMLFDDVLLALDDVPEPDVDATNDDLRHLRVVVSEAQPNPDFATDYLIQNLIRPRSLVVLASTEGLGKSRIRKELDIRLAAGMGPFLGFFSIAAPARVVEFDAEQGEDLEYELEDKVLATLELDRGALGDRLIRYSFPGFTLSTPEGLAVLDAALERDRPQLATLDTAGMFLDGEEWGKELRNALKELIKRTQRFECSFLLVVHLVKPSREGRGKPQDGQRRALTDVMGQWGRQATTVMLMSGAAGEDRVHLDVYKRVPNVRLMLAQKDELWEVVASGDGGTLEARLNLGLDRTDMKILTAIADKIPVVAASGVGESAFFERLKVLRKDGFVAPGTPYELLSKGQDLVDGLSGAESGESPEE